MRYRKHPRGTRPYHVVSYTSCPECDSWSIGVRADGRIVRHSIGCGSVGQLSKAQIAVGMKRGTICAGSLRRA